MMTETEARNEAARRFPHWSQYVEREQFVMVETGAVPADYFDAPVDAEEYDDPEGAGHEW